MKTNCTILPMTHDEAHNQGANLVITYQFDTSPFGRLLMASTDKGLCSLTLVSDETTALERLKVAFPKASILAGKGTKPLNVETLFTNTLTGPVSLHLKGTPFQVSVWKALLEIPYGKTTTYGDIANRIGHPKASRAVGSAVGDNPIFFLIPCHRVILSSGAIGQYFWGTALKSAILEWEKQLKAQMTSSPPLL